MSARWVRSINSRVSRNERAVLATLAIGFVLFGLVLGVGVELTAGTSSDDTDSEFETFTDTNTIESEVVLAESVFDDSGYTDNHVVVTFGGELVSGSVADADETPQTPIITVSGDPLVSLDGETVETMDGEEQLKTIDEDGVTATLDDGLRVRDGGEIETENETLVGVDGSPIKYDSYDEEALTATFDEIDNYTEGEQLSVSVDVTSIGYDSIREEAKLYGLDSEGGYDDVLLGNQRIVERGGGNSTPETFDHDLEAGDHQIDELRFEIGDEAFTDTINITAAQIGITEFETNEPVEGEDLVVNVEFERFGELDLGDREATFSIDGEEQNSTSLDLSYPGETMSEEFVYETSTDDTELEVEVGVPGDSNIEQANVPVVSEGDHNERMSVNITNEPAANFSDNLEVETEIDYDGDIPNGEVDVPTEFLVGDTVSNATNVTVGDGGPTETTFSTELNESSVPVTNVTVQTPGQSETIEFRRNLTTTFSVNESFAVNESLEAVVELENNGNTPEYENVTVSVNDETSVVSNGTKIRSIPINASETVEETFTYEVVEGSPAELELEARMMNTTETVTTNRPMFVVEDAELDGADDRDTPLNMSGNVTNTGEITDIQTVEFFLEGEVVAEEEVRLEADESETVSAEIDRPEEDGEYGFGMAVDNGGPSTSEPAEGSAQIDVSGTSLLDRLSSLALPLLLVGLLLAGVVALKYRDDPQAFKRRIATAQSTVQSAVQGLVGGGGSVIVENGLPRDSTVRIQVKDANGVVFQEDLQLADGEQREFPSLPDGGQFEVGVGVDDVASHSEVFQGPTDSVGVVLQPDGITIAEL